MSPNLRGLIPIVPTPFDRNRALDLAGLGRIVDYLVDVGVHGMAVLGMAGETYALTEAERADVLSVAAAHIRGRVPLVAGCSHNSGTAVAQLAVESQKCGADVLMVMPPAMGAPGPAMILHYFRELAEATNLPIMIQDNPAWTGVQLSTGLYAELCELDTVQYAKVETRHPPTTMAAVVDAVGDRLTILGGQAGTWLPEELGRGAVGTMPAAIIPQVFIRILQLWDEGEREEARALFDRFHPLIRVTGTPHVGIPMSKELYLRLGLIDDAIVRTPLPPLAAQDLADFDAVCSALDVLKIMQDPDWDG